jgi:hypothetical protein
LGYEFGTNYIVKDHVVINLGARFNVPLRYKQLNFLRDVSDDSLPDNLETYQATNSQYFKQHAITRLSTHSAFTVYLGIGGLLF